MRLRVIDFGLVPALRSQAVYHGLAKLIDEDSDPILSLASPETPYVCVGRHQEVNKEVDEAFCAAHNLPVYRRRVGGGAVYLDHNQLFTHFIYPRKKAPEFAKNLYPLFIEPVVRTYRDFGVEASYRPVNDIHVNGRKIGGTGAASIGDATLMVGSFMYDFDTETMSKCLKVPSEKFRDKLRQTLNDYMTTMVKELGIPPARSDLIENFLGHCHDVLGVDPEFDQPTAAELAAIAEAEAELADPEFIHLKGKKLVDMGVKISASTHLTESAFKAPGGMIRVHLLGTNNKVGDLMISGDFTCLPHEGVDQLSEALKGTELSQDALATAAGKAISDLGIEMPGIEPNDIATAIMMAAQPAE
ncbi:MAG: lipoate--protein ligase family protein [Hyphomicrobiaceae bacterium]|nr:lipoate--protein ligase family protein [Hyphomicrobiaceae bacterium]